MLILITGIAATAAFVLAYLYYRARGQVSSLRARYGSIIDVDSAVTARSAQLHEISAQLQEITRKAEAEKAQLRSQYSSALRHYDQLRAEIALLEEHVDDMSFGLYEPHFDFRTSEEFKAALERARGEQKRLVRAGAAAVCDAKWTVGGSAREGERMAKQNIKLFLRAFNAECDAAIANVAWNNARKMVERIKKSFEALNKLGTVLQVAISEQYLQLRLDELRLTYEHERKRQEEKDEQRRIREQIREEERVQRELARAQEEAEKEEARYERALAKARSEVERASGAKLADLQTQILQLEASLAAAHEQKLRAVSRAQLTKSGYVYIISNIGAFGDGVYKVGMTRRLEPMDRIAELGDASVPFPFDVHAMLYSDNAPELERSLHDFLHEKRVNLVNPRKEFFTASLSDIERFAKDRGILVEFSIAAEAREYHESHAIRAAAGAASVPVHPTFAEDPFVEDPADMPLEA